MAVLLPDGQYTVRRREHPEEEDAHGVPVPSALALSDPLGPYEGATTEQGDGTYTFRLPPEAAPVLPDDVITGNGVDLVVVTVRIYRNVADPAADYLGGRASRTPPRVL